MPRPACFGTHGRRSFRPALVRCVPSFPARNSSRLLTCPTVSNSMLATRIRVELNCLVFDKTLKVCHSRSCPMGRRLIHRSLDSARTSLESLGPRSRMRTRVASPSQRRARARDFWRWARRTRTLAARARCVGWPDGGDIRTLTGDRRCSTSLRSMLIGRVYLPSYHCSEPDLMRTPQRRRLLHLVLLDCRRSRGDHHRDLYATLYLPSETTCLTQFTVFLYQLLGYAAFVGISVAVLFLPLNHYTSKAFANVQDKLVSSVFAFQRYRLTPPCSDERARQAGQPHERGAAERSHDQVHGH